MAFMDRHFDKSRAFGFALHQALLDLGCKGLSTEESARLQQLELRLATTNEIRTDQIWVEVLFSPPAHNGVVRLTPTLRYSQDQIDDLKRKQAPRGPRGYQGPSGVCGPGRPGTPGKDGAPGSPAVPGPQGTHGQVCSHLPLRR